MTLPNQETTDLRSALPGGAIRFKVELIMKPGSVKTKDRGLTLVEVLLVIVLLYVLAAMLLPAYSGPGKARTAICLSNQKRLVMGFQLWKDDNANQFPWQISETNNGSMESAERGYAAPVFQVLSNYVKQPIRYICPADKDRKEALGFDLFRNENLSYFVAFDQGRQPASSILTGDRHLESNGTAAKTGPFVYSTDLTMDWTREIHGKMKTSYGVMSFVDGHAQGIKGPDLNAIFQFEGVATNHLAIP